MQKRNTAARGLNFEGDQIDLMKKEGLIETPLTIGMDESNKGVAYRASILTQKGRAIA